MGRPCPCAIPATSCFETPAFALLRRAPQHEAGRQRADLAMTAKYEAAPAAFCIVVFAGICWHPSTMTMRPGHPAPSALRKLLTHEASGGLILIASAAIALVVANSGAADFYAAALERKV